jgi:Uma2 family endonuclease
MDMSITVEKLKSSPRLGQYFQEIKDVLASEGALRLKFYEEITDQQKAEFVNGEVIMHSPARYKHSSIVDRLIKMLSTFVDIHELGVVRSEKLMISLTRNDYEPDIVFFPESVASAFTPDQWQFPAPAFIAEVLSPTTETVDRTIKFDDYAAHGVTEYWIVDPEIETIEQYELQDDKYRLRIKTDNGEVHSLVIPGLLIPVRAVFDTKLMMEELKRILMS